MLAKLDSRRSISLLALGTASVLSRTALRCSFGSGGSRPSDGGGGGGLKKNIFGPLGLKIRGPRAPLLYPPLSWGRSLSNTDPVSRLPQENSQLGERLFQKEGQL